MNGEDNKSRVMSLVRTAALAVCSILILSLIVITCCEVFFRFVLGAPTSWTSGVSSVLLIWLGLLSAFMAIADDKNLRLEFIIDRLKGRAHQAVEILIYCAMFATICVFVVLGWRYFYEAYKNGWVHHFGDLTVSMALTRGALPAVGLGILVVLAAKIIGLIRKG